MVALSPFGVSDLILTYDLVWNAFFFTSDSFVDADFSAIEFKLGFLLRFKFLDVRTFFSEYFLGFINKAGINKIMDKITNKQNLLNNIFSMNYIF